MHTETEIRRRKDGSIDTTYYMAKAHDARSAQAHQMGVSMWQLLAQRLKNIVSLPKPHESIGKPCA